MTSWFGSLAIDDAAVWTWEYFQENDVVSHSTVTLTGIRQSTPELIRILH
jgi:hypothetical protein